MGGMHVLSCRERLGGSVERDLQNTLRGKGKGKCLKNPLVRSE